MPLWQQTAEVRAKTELDVSQKDKNYWEMGVLTETEITLSRDGGSTYSQDTKIGDARTKEMMKENDNFKESDLTVNPEPE